MEQHQVATGADNALNPGTRDRRHSDECRQRIDDELAKVGDARIERMLEQLAEIMQERV